MKVTIESNGKQLYVYEVHKHSDCFTEQFLHGTFLHRRDAELFRAALVDERLPAAISLALVDAASEIDRARNWLDFPPMRSAHEGFAILMEEFDELKAHVWSNQKKRDIAAMRAEAIQVAAMALCFAAEVCNEETGRK